MPAASSMHQLALPAESRDLKTRNCCCCCCACAEPLIRARANATATAANRSTPVSRPIERRVDTDRQMVLKAPSTSPSMSKSIGKKNMLWTSDRNVDGAFRRKLGNPLDDVFHFAAANALLAAFRRPWPLH